MSPAVYPAAQDTAKDDAEGEAGYEAADEAVGGAGDEDDLGHGQKTCDSSTNGSDDGTGIRAFTISHLGDLFAFHRAIITPFRFRCPTLDVSRKDQLRLYRTTHLW